jgi:hypothetical protein
MWLNNVTKDVAKQCGLLGLKYLFIMLYYNK